MNIELLDFYPIEIDSSRETLIGTIRVGLPDARIQILGITASKRKNSWFFTLPGRKCDHHETGETIRYPFIVFNDEGEKEAFFAELRLKAPTFIAEWIAKDNLVKCPAMQDNTPEKVKPLSDTKIETATRKKAIIEKMNPRHNLPNKTWIDIPAKKPAARKKQVNGD